MEVVARAQVGHALVVDVIQAGLGALGVPAVLGPVGGPRGHVGQAGQHGHAGVEGVSLVAVAGRRALVLGVLVGEQREEALAVLLRDSPP